MYIASCEMRDLKCINVLPVLPIRYLFVKFVVVYRTAKAKECVLSCLR